MPATKKRTKCVECGARLSAHRLKWHANTCSARCGQARHHRFQYGETRRRAKPEVKPTENPPVLGLTLVEAAERIGISRQTAHTHCVEHGLGRRYNDGKWWLTLTELRTLAERPWRERAE
jgi:hypothetical protein